TFPTAKYIFGRVECEYWEAQVNEGNDLAGRIWTDSCLPLIRSGRVEQVEMDADLGGGLSLRPAPSHTPGMFCVELARDGGERIMFVAHRPPPPIPSPRARPGTRLFRHPGPPHA